MADGQNRTYPASARRLQKARDNGDVPLSREMAGVCAFAFACGVLGLFGIALFKGGLLTLRAIIGDLHDKDLTGGSLSRVALITTMQLSIPFLVASVFGAAAGVLVQTRFLFHAQAVKFDVSRLDPVRGFKRLFGTDGLIELVKSAFKLTLLISAGWYICRSKLRELLLLPMGNLGDLFHALATLTAELLVAAGLVQASMAILDVVVVRLRFQLRHKMSRDDMKEEFKETEGNPHTKSRIRRLQRARRRHMTAAVKTATVVVTNPTHYAVALVYDRSKSAAPKVAAKGADLVAQRIRDLAKMNNVPIVENPVLARALFRLDWDSEIPPEHYKAVAEIVAFVWRIKGRSTRA